MRTLHFLLAPLLIWLSAGAAAQDSMLLADGRFVAGPKMTRKPEGIVLHLQAGDVFVPGPMVKSASVSAREGMAEEEPSDADKKYLDRGFVSFEGKWMRPAERDQLMAKRREATQARIEEAMAHSKWVNRYKTDSRYFEFEYTIDPEIMDYWAKLMDAYYKTFTDYWKIRPPAGHKKLNVKFHHDEKFFQQIAGAPPGALGFFRFVPPLDLQFYNHRLDHGLTLNVMFHECNHYLVWLHDPEYKYPVWLNEGLAEYYGASVWDGKKLEVGGLLESRLASVQQDIIEDNWLGLEEMIKIPHSEFGGQYYGWAWTFVHFMLHTKYEKAFKKFFVGLCKDTSLERVTLDFGTYRMKQHPPEQVIVALKKGLRVKDLESLESEWHGYIKNLQPSSARGYFEFGRRALYDGMPIKAKRVLEMAIEKGHESPLLHVYYAQALEQVPTKTADERIKNLEAAVESYAKVIAADPINPEFRVGYARLMDRLARRKRQPDSNVVAQLEIAKELGEAVNGGELSTEIWRATAGWKPYSGGDADEDGE